MRLRPNGDSGPLVCCFDMLENYFVTQGREWERYAWIKARVMLGERWPELEQLARPFVFRKYLDFGCINAMRELHAQIRREVARHGAPTTSSSVPAASARSSSSPRSSSHPRRARPALQVRPTLAVLARRPSAASFRRRR